MYGFNPLTPMDLIPLAVDERVSLDSNRKAQVVIRISPTPSVIMPMTHWRCQLGQSQELLEG